MINYPTFYANTCTCMCILIWYKLCLELSSIPTFPLRASRQGESGDRDSADRANPESNQPIRRARFFRVNSRINTNPSQTSLQEDEGEEAQGQWLESQQFEVGRFSLVLSHHNDCNFCSHYSHIPTPRVLTHMGLH